MKSRCTNTKMPCFKNYGGRGITVCERWQSFNNFLADMGERPEGHTIERKNNDGNYEPDNCEWIPASDQPLNMRRTLRVTLNEKTFSAAGAARLLGVNYSTFHRRIRKDGIPSAVAWAKQRNPKMSH